jgi:hypothetical protein
LTTGSPQAAATMAVPVEMLRLFDPSPPVPTMSIDRNPAGTSGRSASLRMARAKPRNSAAETPLLRSAARIAPAIAGASSAFVSRISRFSASASARSRRSSRHSR